MAHHWFPDHYATLGVPSAASAAEIDRAYRARIRRVHPDLGTDPTDRARRTALAARLNAAAGVLRDPARRAAYDLARERATLRAAGAAASCRSRAPSSVPPAAPSPRRPSAAAPPAAGGASRPGRAPAMPDPRRRSVRQPLAWLCCDRVGQWVVLLVVATCVAGLSPAFGVAAPDGPAFVARMTGGWLVLGALLTRNLDNPLGDLVRATARLARWLLLRVIAA